MGRAPLSCALLLVLEGVRAGTPPRRRNGGHAAIVGRSLQSHNRPERDDPGASASPDPSAPVRARHELPPHLLERTAKETRDLDLRNLYACGDRGLAEAGEEVEKHDASL